MKDAKFYIDHIIELLKHEGTETLIQKLSELANETSIITRAEKSFMEAGWKKYPHERPAIKKGDLIKAYPIAIIFDDTVIIDYADYNPQFSIAPWMMTTGEIAEPFAWFDLPPLPVSWHSRKS